MDNLTGTRFDSLKWAIRALRTETVAFRFEYPLKIDLAAGPKDSLHYYIYSDALSWGALSLDSMGIARCCYPVTGIVYRPAFVAWYGLVNLGHYLRRRDQMNLDVFLNQVSWLERNAVLRDDGAVVWPMNFDSQEGATVLKAPWISANAQGLVISALVRGWRVTQRPQLLELLNKSWKVFEIEIDHDGLREVMNGHVLYAEIRGHRLLDHFLTALLGLYDLLVETGDGAVGQLFAEGIEGLKSMLATWDYRKRWSWYGGHDYLCPPAYHCLNRVLLSVIARLSDELCLAEYAECWDLDRLSMPARVEIFLRFLLTKNACRFKHRTWRQKRIPA